MSKKITKKASLTRPADLQPEYRLDYTQSRPNRFAGKTEPVVVMLADDVAKVFKDGESVNAALRAILQAVPRRTAR